MKYHPLRISQIKRLTQNAVTISFEVPDSERFTFDFFAGQYLTLSAEISEKTVRRAYSICSVAGGKELSVAVKQIPNGVFSSFANTQLTEGEILNVSPPKGKFAFIPEIYPENLALFAVGSGITPIISIAKTALKQGSQKILLFLGDQSEATSLFWKEILALRRDFPERFFVEHFLSQSQSAQAHSGRMSVEAIHRLLTETYQSIDFQRFYICLPQEFTNEVRAYLSEKYNPKQIHSELFIAQKVIEKKYKGTTQLSVSVQGQTHTFTAKREISILDALLQQGLKVAHSCRNGVCSSCLAQITEGSAEMVKNEVLSESEVNQGVILCCQAHPTSEELSINYLGE